MAAAYPTPEENLDAGVAAFRAGRFEEARDDFLAARAGGLGSAQLQYDLALAYYKLGQDAEAQAAFERLKKFREYADIADFHLALLAVRAGRRDEAAQTFERLAQSPASAVRQRAQVALQRLRRDRAAAASAYVLAAAGQDSNPGQVEDTVQAPAADSAFADLFGTFDLRVAGSRAAATHVRSGGYLHNYWKDNRLDQRGVFGALAQTFEHDGRRNGGFVEANVQQLDGAAFINAYTAGVAAEPQPGATGYALRGEASRLDAAPAYGYLEGWRARAELERIGDLGALRTRLGYQFEYNARDDLSSGPEFFSHSPLRHRLQLAIDRPLGPGWYVDASLRDRYSRYREPNRFLDAGVLREERRVENLLQAGLQLRRSLGASLDAVLEYQYSRNDASIAGFGYRRQVLSLGLEWAPHG